MLSSPLRLPGPIRLLSLFPSPCLIRGHISPPSQPSPPTHWPFHFLNIFLSTKEHWHKLFPLPKLSPTPSCLANASLSFRSWFKCPSPGKSFQSKLGSQFVTFPELIMYQYVPLPPAGSMTARVFAQCLTVPGTTQGLIHGQHSISAKGRNKNTHGSDLGNLVRGCRKRMSSVWGWLTYLELGKDLWILQLAGW